MHTAVLHADTDLDLFAEPPEESELCEDEVWNLYKALSGYRNAPNLWHQHVVTLLKSQIFSPLLTDSSCFTKLEFDINMSMHVGDGLLFGPNIEIQPLIEHLSTQSHDAHCGTNGTAGRSNVLSCLGDRKNRSWILGCNEFEVHPRRITMLGLEDSRPVASPSVKRTPPTESLVELENDRRAVYKTAVGKLLHMLSTRTTCTELRKQHERSCVPLRATR